MSREDDATSKTADSRKPASIPAPATVPRPSRPPGASASSPPPAVRPLSTPPPGMLQAGQALGPASEGAPTQRRGTLSGVPPPPTYPGFSEEEFDAERTMVVDPDDAPTADYDPRVASPYGPGPGTAPRVTEMVPQPRASEMGRRRTSRRTVKIPEDPVKRKDKPANVDVEAPPAMASAAAPPAPAMDFGDGRALDGAPDALPEAADFVDEITIVRPLRIIDVGNEPPPPIRSAFATWPPAPQFGEAPIEAGWTPAAPAVIDALSHSGGDAATPLDPLPRADLAAVEAELRTPVAPPVVMQEAVAPRAPMTSAPEISVEPAVPVDVTDGVDITPESVPEHGEILEEIEPDAAPIAPKRPPPPPPKKQEQKLEPVPEREPQRPKAWFEDIFSDEYIRTHDRPDSSLVRREVDFIEESLAVEKHAVVLDLACGMGDHANELAARGYSVVGFDLSSGMLDIAKRGAKRRLGADPAFSPPTFTQGDMREMAYEEAFDGVYCWSTSFGYFDEDKNLAVLASVHRALRQGGMFLLDVVNRDYVAPRSPSLVWFEGTQCVCMDDVFVDYFTSRLRVKRTAMFEGGLSRELDYSIRLYSLNELGKMLKEVGFKVVEVTGHTSHPGVFFGTESPRMIVLAERS